MYQSLQAGRAAAAALVVLFHLGGTFAQDKYFGFKPLDGPFAWGDAGVEFFFVLSGFLITIAHRRDFGRPQALPAYVAKRLWRIYPTYWLICVAVCAAAWVVAPLRASLPNDLWIFLLGLALIPQDPAVVGGTGSPILFVAWSLHYEMLFYLLVAVTILNRAAGLGAAVLVLGVHMSCRFGNACGFPASFLANNLIFVFSFGVIGAYLMKSRFRLGSPRVTGIAATACFIAFGLFEVWYGRDRLAIDRRLVYGLLGAVIIVAFAQAEEARASTLKHGGIKLLGDSSYALYLLHIPIISVMCKLLAKTGVASPAAIVGMFVLVFAACEGLSVLFHLTVERRLLSVFKASRQTRGTASKVAIGGAPPTSKDVIADALPNSKDAIADALPWDGRHP